jgi:hypothetical protein
VSLVLVVLLCALALGWLIGGGLDRLGALHLAHRWLVLAAFAALLGGTAHALGLLLSAGFAFAFLERNRGVRGTGLIALGLLANAVVVAVNGAMPVSLHAADRAGADVTDVLDGSDPRHELAGSGTRLSWLGDVVPVRLPRHPEVVSPGDVLLAAGIAQLVVIGMGGGLGGRVQGRGSPRPGPSRSRGRPGSRHLR